ncbi:hypothetical protein [Streptomyces flaveus]|uniref:hypothetical protein n=1 Tax=Streptomyces flaveus TaxID=66370 RepID=UPI00332A2A05
MTKLIHAPPPHAATHAVPILDGRHELAITRLKRKDDCFTLHYTITPALPDSDSDAPLLPVLEPQDDLANEYDDRGGANGPSPDGSRTDGSLTAQPALPPQASTLLVRVTFLRAGVETS